MLQHWKQQGHKALFFTQTQQMLDIVERAVQAAGFRCAGCLLQYSESFFSGWGIHASFPVWRDAAVGIQSLREHLWQICMSASRTQFRGVLGLPCNSCSLLMMLVSSRHADDESIWGISRLTASRTQCRGVPGLLRTNCSSWHAGLLLLLLAFPARRQGTSCRQAAIKGCHNPTTCWTRHLMLD